jgi:hypothetical protein
MSFQIYNKDTDLESLMPEGKHSSAILINVNFIETILYDFGQPHKKVNIDFSNFDSIFLVSFTEDSFINTKFHDIKDKYFEGKTLHVITSHTNDKIEVYKQRYEKQGFNNACDDVIFYDWPYSMLNHVVSQYENRLDYKPFHNYDTFQSTLSKQFNFLYINKTGKHVRHRMELHESLYKNNLFDIGINTSIENKNSLKSIYGDKDIVNKFKPFDSHKYLFKNENFGGITDEYRSHTALIEVVTETLTEYIRFTEKTWKPILNQRPFLILGGLGIHQKLRDLGFKLFDDIFDYSFDEEISRNKRIDGIINNLNRLKNKNWKSIYKRCRPTIKHNYELLKKIYYYDTTFTKGWTDVLNKHDNITILTNSHRQQNTFLLSHILPKIDESKVSNIFCYDADLQGMKRKLT